MGTRRSRLLDLAAVLVALGAAALCLHLRNDRGPGLRERFFGNDAPGAAPTQTRTTHRLVHHGARGGHVEWSGSVLAPWDGAYVFALVGVGEGELRIDGQPVVRLGRRQDGKLNRAFGALLLRRGPHALVATARGEYVSVRWKPPRGVVGLATEMHTYLPAEVLAPTPVVDAAATPLDTIPRRDAAYAWALAALALGLGAYLARTRLRGLAKALAEPAGRVEHGLLFGIVAAYLAIASFRILASGECNDEGLLWVLGRDQVMDLLSLDFSALTWSVDAQHPPVTKYVLGLGALLGDDVGAARHLSSVLGALSIVLVFASARRLAPGDRVAPLLSAALLALYPHALAHHRLGGHEAVTLFLCTLAAYAFLRGLQDGAPGWILLAGVALGLGGAARQNVATFGAFFVVAFFAFGWPLVRAKRWATLGAILLVPLVAAAVVYGMWPHLWRDPVGALAEMTAEWQRKGLGDEWFLGTFHKRLPKSYLWVYLPAATPTAYLAGLGLFLVAGLARARAALVVVLAWIVAPMLSGLGPAVQDGVRYIAPTFAGVALAAGLGFAMAWRALAAWLARSRLARRLVAAVGLAVILVPLAVQDALYFPYYLDYYNELIGPERAQREKLFEVGWWCEGLQPAMAAVNARAKPNATVRVDGPFCDHVRGLRDDLRRAPPGYPTDYVIRRYLLMLNAPPPAGYALVHAEKVMGATLAEVWKRDGAP